MSTQSRIFQIVTGLSIIFGLAPLIWHIRTGNTPAIFLILWLTAYNFCTFMNTFIWPDDKGIWTSWDGHIFCDIQVKIYIASNAGQLGAVAAIARTLAMIMSENANIIQTRRWRRTEMWKNLALCLGIPIWMCSVHYIVQPTRYSITSITGCQPVVDRSWPSIVLLFIWTPIASLIAAFYACLVLARYHKHRCRFKKILSQNSSLSKGRFMRLFVLSGFLIGCLLPINFYIFYRNLNVDRLPYDWALVHGEEWKYVIKYPSFGVVQFDRWISVGTGIVLFFFFGIGADALQMYRSWLILLRIDWFMPNWVMGTNRPNEKKKDGGGWFGKLASQSSTDGWFGGRLSAGLLAWKSLNSTLSSRSSHEDSQTATAAAPTTVEDLTAIAADLDINAVLPKPNPTQEMTEVSRILHHYVSPPLTTYYGTNTHITSTPNPTPCSPNSPQTDSSDIKSPGNSHQRTSITVIHEFSVSEEEKTGLMPAPPACKIG